MKRSTVLNTLKTIISEAIEIEPSEIRGELSLIDDLGIESVDMLYIKSKIESAFNIEWDFVSGLTNPQLVQNGKITAAGVAMLQKNFFDGEFSEIQPGTPIINIIGKFSVNSMVNSIFYKVQSGLK